MRSHGLLKRNKVLRVLWSSVFPRVNFSPPPPEDAYAQPHNDLFSWQWKMMSFASKLSAVIFYNC